MTAKQRMELRQFWREWASRTLTDLGAQLADTIDIPESHIPEIREARCLMIRAESLLSSLE